MAARKRSAVTKGSMPQAWRDRIQASMLVNRLTDHVEGKVELSPSQVTAASILLKKAIPDLAAVTLSGDEDKPIQQVIRWASSRSEGTADPSKKS